MSQPEAAPELSIVLLTKNAGERFSQVLAALLACRGCDRAELLCIDSGSIDGTLELLALHPQIRVHAIAPVQFGHGRTRNLAVRLTRGRVLIFLVQDAIPATPALLEELAAPLADPEIAGVFARQLPHADSDPIERYFLAATYPDLYQVRSWPGSGPLRHHEHFFSNVCSAIRREALLVRPFNEQVIQGEDGHWSRQTLLAGGKTAYAPDARVHHSHHYRLRDLFRRFFDVGSSEVAGSDDTLAWLLKSELAYLATGMRFLVRERSARWIPSFFLRELVKATAFLLGGRSRWLPDSLCRRLSLHSYHWSRQT